MSAPQTSLASAARRESKSRATLIAAYREGLGLAAIAVIRGSAGIRIAAAGNGCDDGLGRAENVVEAKWWCRRATDATRVAAAATARLQRLELRDRPASPSGAVSSHSPRDICAAIENAAQRLHVILHSDEQIAVEATQLIARVDEEIQSLQRAGQLRSVNQSYRTHRMEAATSGAKVTSYAEWFNKYKANLVRQLASALRYV